MQKLTTKAAVLFILADRKISKYRMAKDIGVQPIMIDNYSGPRGTKMGEATAKRFEDIYGIEIIDTYTVRKNNGSETSSNTTS